MKSKYYDFEHEIKPPFHIDIVDQFQGHDEYGYEMVDEYQTFEEVVKVAREITEEGIKACKSMEDWRMFGDAGLVYDSQGLLVWDGAVEYDKTEYNQIKDTEITDAVSKNTSPRSTSQKPARRIFEGEMKPPPGSGFKTIQEFNAYLLRGLDKR